MRFTRTLLVFITGLTTSVYAQQQASRAYDFSESVGVNTHFSYTDTGYYQQPAEVISALRKLHINHIRDGLAYFWVAPNLYAIYTQLEPAGIHPELVMPNPKNGAPSAKQIETLLPNYPGADAIEAPNEYDQSKDPNWVANLSAYLPTLRQVQRDTGLPVIGPSLTKPASYAALGVVSQHMEVNNLHAYWGGRNPETSGWGGLNSAKHAYGSMEYDFDNLNIDGPGLPVIMTESGYVASDIPKQNVIPESVEAIYEPRLVLHAWNKGIKRTYIYELMDEHSSTTGFGLLRSDFSPRPAYTALANFMELLDDRPGDFLAGKLNYSLTGNTQGVETTLLQKQDGSFWLAIWLKGCIYDVNALKATPIAPAAVQLKIADGKKVKSMWNFDEAGNAHSVLPNSAMVDLSVTSGITLLKIN